MNEQLLAQAIRTEHQLLLHAASRLPELRRATRPGPLRRFRTALARKHFRGVQPDAKFDLSGLMLGRPPDHIDTTLVVDHTTTGCESRELFKAVLDDRARAVFQGKIVVAPQAQKTDGKQMAQALMLSEDAEFDSKPELEIYADDVVCGHGSTVSEIDPEMMFYLRSRGLPRDDMVFVEEFFDEASDNSKNEFYPPNSALGQQTILQSTSFVGPLVDKNSAAPVSKTILPNGLARSGSPLQTPPARP